MREQENDKIAALDAGADDYLTKPFGAGELMARIRGVLRRSVQSESEPVFSSGNLSVDLTLRTVLIDNQPITLTPTEYDLLKTLIKHAGKVLTHRQLLHEVWGGVPAAQPTYLRVYMAGLRKKIEADPARPRLLMTEPGVGYRLKV